MAKTSSTKSSRSKSGDVTDAAVPSDAGQTTGTQPPLGASAHYVVLARKYRPRTFADLIGQDAMVRTLENAFRTGRIAQAFMLTGVRGVGKTTTARILARALNYEPAQDGNAAASGPTTELASLGVHCADIMDSRHPDVLEMDAASNTGVDNVREIIESARYRPVSARYKVFIIDEVHMLSKGAFNALLKTLEEPPEHVKFIFATTEPRKVPVTVLSRCQRFDLKRVDATALAGHLGHVVASEGGDAEEDALAMITRAAEGSVRDALSILDQALAISTGRVTTEQVRGMLGLADRGRIFDLVEITLGGQAGAALELYERLHGDGAEPVQILSDLAEAVHIITRARIAGHKRGADMLSDEEWQRAAGFGERLGVALLSRAWQMLVTGLDEARRAPDTFAAGEMVLVRLAYMAELPTPDDLMRKLNAAAPQGGDNAAPASAGEGAGGRDAHAHVRPPDAPAGDSDDDGVKRPSSFAEVVELVGQMRDIRMKIDLEEQARPVAFQPGRIEIALEEGAPSSLANELTQRLNAWTGERWMVIVSNKPGGKTLGEERREREAAEIAAVKADPLMQDLFRHFPDARIGDVRPLEAGEADGEAAPAGRNAEQES